MSNQVCADPHAVLSALKNAAKEAEGIAVDATVKMCEILLFVKFAMVQRGRDEGIVERGVLHRDNK